MFICIHIKYVGITRDHKKKEVVSLRDLILIKRNIIIEQFTQLMGEQGTSTPLKVQLTFSLEGRGMKNCNFSQCLTLGELDLS